MLQKEQGDKKLQVKSKSISAAHSPYRSGKVILKINISELSTSMKQGTVVRVLLVNKFNHRIVAWQFEIQHNADSYVATEKEFEIDADCQEVAIEILCQENAFEF